MTVTRPEYTLYASAARTATPAAAAFASQGARGLHLVIDVTAVTSTPSVVFTIDAKDTLSGKWYNLLTSAAVTGTGTTVLKIYPGITVAANVSVSDTLPNQLRLVATHGNANSISYSATALMLA